MEKEILKLINNYAKKEKEADLMFIKKLIEIVITKRRLGSYVKQVRVINKFETEEDSAIVCAEYNPYSTEIIVHYPNIKVILETMDYYIDLFNQTERTMFKNLLITQYLLHELEHASQFKQSDDVLDRSIEAKLVRPNYIVGKYIRDIDFAKELLNNDISSERFDKYIKIMDKLNKEYYRFNPIERLAQVRSFQTILNILEPIKETVPNLYEFNGASLVEEMIKGYDDALKQNKCPTEIYLNSIKRKDVWKDLDFYDDDREKLLENVNNTYSKTKRLILGLPITQDEYYSKQAWLEKTNKYRV